MIAGLKIGMLSFKQLLHRILSLKIWIDKLECFAGIFKASTSCWMVYKSFGFSIILQVGWLQPKLSTAGVYNWHLAKSNSLTLKSPEIYKIFVLKIPNITKIPKHN